MPELPEVEVLRAHLAQILPGRRIQSVHVHLPRVTRPWTGPMLANAWSGAVFDKVHRRGKHLVFHLQGPTGPNTFLHAHLGMTGRILVEDACRPLPRHAAVVLGLGSHRWVLVDPRQFGRVGIGPVSGLGPEPLADTFTPAQWAPALTASRQPIKARLLDQSVVAGLGNIYANEALHRAGIRPGRPSNRLQPAEIQRLHHAIRDVLQEAILLGRSLHLDVASGADGLFYFGSATPQGSQPPHPPQATERWAVYDRDGHPCPRCRAPVRRFLLGGRSTFECRGCQS